MCDVEVVEYEMASMCLKFQVSRSTPQVGALMQHGVDFHTKSWTLDHIRDHCGK